MTTAVMCPQCNAPLSPHRFARSIVCAYCGATVQLDEAVVAAEKFHEAYRAWNSPTSYQIASWVSLDDKHWALERCIAHGERTDVYTGRRARWPTELVILKLLRESKDAELFENEWESLKTLHRSQARGADLFGNLLPQLVLHGNLGSGQYAGMRVSIFRRASGFRHTLEDVMKAHPQGIPPRTSIWVWRRILEMLSFLHASGMVHGALLPSHLLIQDNEHGVRMISFSCAGRPGEALRRVSPGYEGYYPQDHQPGRKLTAQMDLSMSARCVAAVLGGDPETATLPEAVPVPLADVVRRVALHDTRTQTILDAWALREELGVLSERVFGPPAFNPIRMPD